MSHHTRGRKAAPRAATDGLTRSPTPPRWLSTEGKAEWRRIMPGLVARRVLTDGDLSTAENYTMAIGTIRRCRATIDLEGETIDGPHGPKRHPCYQTLFQALTEARRLAAELGLTPASRSRVSGGEDAPDDDDNPLAD